MGTGSSGKGCVVHSLPWGSNETCQGGASHSRLGSLPIAFSLLTWYIQIWHDLKIHENRCPYFSEL